MSTRNPTRVLVGGLLLLGATVVCAGDWPQWRGPTRDNKVPGFTAPKTWPKELTRKWSVKVGQSDAGPVLVGDKVYTFTRDGGDEIIRCLEAATGKEVWSDKYAAEPASGGAAGHPGPRCSPVVAEGKICCLGVGGVLSCLDAATGKVVWRKDTKARPMFFTASSPIITEGKCIAYLGSDNKGTCAAFDLASGEEKWNWTGAGTPYGSPVLATIEGTKQIVTPTRTSVVGLSVTDGKLLWQYAIAGKYQNGTPIVDGNVVIYTASNPPTPTTVALKIEKSGDTFTAKEAWKNNAGPGQYNTPTMVDGVLYGIASGGGGFGGKGKGGGGGGGKGGFGRGKGPAPAGSGNFFCMDPQTGKVLWKDTARCGDCGAVYDVGGVLVALSNDSHLVVFKPTKKAYEEVAKYKVAETPCWAPPAISGNRLFVKDYESLTLYVLE